MNTKLQIIELNRPREPRLRARRINEEAIITDLANRAIETGKLWVHASHGGTVCNGYGYRAATEAIGVIAAPDGRVLVRYNRIPANKATLAGAISATLGGQFRPLKDGRYNAASRLPAWKAAHEYLEAQFAARN